MLTLRVELKDRSDLGEFGARAIRDALKAKGITQLPSARTIGRILERHGALDGRKRTRRPAPPAGWYLPDLAARRAELDSSDIVEGLVIKGGTRVEVLNATSLHGGLVASWPMGVVTAKAAVELRAIGPVAPTHPYLFFSDSRGGPPAGKPLLFFRRGTR